MLINQTNGKATGSVPLRPPLTCRTSPAKCVEFRRSPSTSALNKNSPPFADSSCFSTRKMHRKVV
ncbi:hypothetical protein ASPSYDRAFT_50622 [Aspergillus sydowii CBS 593.65]|uniref:Uncharacterized protein n=1 Tax=Aspergillus sydowii CBS 593.65 TaxID=1036612 RepID=A0A1L9T3E2_9EURO|nr:uncharacterized protein ASPSYDRAFT_50622 [Aspergillus sydowii CBS 593.65]OJJ53861.1 hypothetical protein ASPSYDRAFT_50622 [Aspergillus sydowii CBS 593.65]